MKKLKVAYKSLKDSTKAIIWLVIGACATLAPTYLEKNTLLFTSKIRIVSGIPPKSRFIEIKETDQEKQMLIETSFLLYNSGFKDGELVKVAIEPVDLKAMPKIQIIHMHSVSVPARTEQWGSVRYIVYKSKPLVDDLSYGVAFFDEYDKRVGGLHGIVEGTKAKDAL